MINGKIVIECSRVELNVEQTQVEENLIVKIYDGKRLVKKLIFEMRPDSVQNLGVFMEHKTK